MQAHRGSNWYWAAGDGERQASSNRSQDVVYILTAKQRRFDLHLHHRGADQDLRFKSAVLYAVHPHAAALAAGKGVAKAGDAVVDEAQDRVHMRVWGVAG